MIRSHLGMLGSQVEAIKKSEKSERSEKPEKPGKVREILPLNNSEASYIRRAGLNPSEYMSPRTLAHFWGVDQGLVRVANHRGLLPEVVKIGKRVFFPTEKTLKSWSPRIASHEVFSEIPDLNPSSGVSGPEDTSVPMGRSETPTFVETQLVDPQATKNYVPIKRSTRTKMDLPERTEINIDLSPTVKTPTQQQYLKTMAQVATLEEWVAITLRAVQDAKDGDSRARKWLSDYLIGTPVQRIAALVHETKGERFSDEERANAVVSMILGANGTGEGVDLDDMEDVDYEVLGDSDGSDDSES